MKPGVYNISNQEYHGGPGLSCSAFKEFLRSPAHYKHYTTAERVETAAMAVGTAIHTAVLEPEKFKTEIAIAPECDRRTKAGKEEYAAFLAVAKGKTIITAKDHANILGMVDGVKRCIPATKLLESGFAELSFFAQDPEYEILWKVRPDWLTPAGAVVDLKKCQDSSPEGFQKQIGNYQYHIQAALYLKVLSWATGKNHSTFFFVAIEEQPPHVCAVYELDFRSIDAANLRINTARGQYAECLKNDKWPGYTDSFSICVDNEILTTGVPKWAA